ncbi:MAG: hypothetical protein HS113_00635 [Verrucomicrobiales bacterium]|nr:hypothetical protein [Verrucomicrobiales bacterium]
MKPNTHRPFLSRSLPVLLALPLAWTLAAQDQVDPFSNPAPPPARALPAANRAVDVSQLMHFDLEFPGGSPMDFLAAVAEASGKEVNAIIPRDCEDTDLPAIRVKNVNIVDLFQALEAASRRTVAVVTGHQAGRPPIYQQFETSFGFRTYGVPSDEAIWYFYRKTPSLPPESPSATPAPDRRVRYFNLGRYLETYPLEDITTAIQTGWKMLRHISDQPVPEMNFHKDTQLLIAVGDLKGIEVIAQVLSELGRGAPRGGSAEVPPVPTQPVPGTPALPAMPAAPAATPGFAPPPPPAPAPVAPPSRER